MGGTYILELHNTSIDLRVQVGLGGITENPSPFTLVRNRDKLFSEWL